MKERWWTAPVEGDSGRTVLVTGRDYMDEVMAGGKYDVRITVGWDYESQPRGGKPAGVPGMPTEEEAKLMEAATDALMAAFKKDKVAYMTGIYTGDGRRDWIFYTKNLHIFGTVFNRALADIEQLPLSIEAESDPDWGEYLEMRELSYIPADDEE